jgi:hypothetical protein
MEKVRPVKIVFIIGIANWLDDEGKIRTKIG